VRKIEVVGADAIELGTAYRAPFCRVTGVVHSGLSSPAGASIWMLTAIAARGARFDWDERHGDEALFVQHGELEVDGRSCPTGGAVVIEANALPAITAKVDSRVVHMGPRDAAAPRSGMYGPAKPGPPNVHVVGPRGTFEALEEGRETRFFADSTCPGCRLWLLYTSRSFAFDSEIHSHSQDELIHVLRGEIQLGSHTLGPGATIFIAADQPYGFRAGEEGFAFLNYRRDASEMTTRSTGRTIVESGAATGLQFVTDLR